MSLLLVWSPLRMHLWLCHPFLITAALCLEEMLHVPGAVFLFIGSLREKTTKYFLGPLNVSFGLWKAEINVATRPRAPRLSLLPSLDGKLCVGMGWGRQLLRRDAAVTEQRQDLLGENLGGREKS